MKYMKVVLLFLFMSISYGCSMDKSEHLLEFDKTYNLGEGISIEILDYYYGPRGLRSYLEPLANNANNQPAFIDFELMITNTSNERIRSIQGEFEFYLTIDDIDYMGYLLREQFDPEGRLSMSYGDEITAINSGQTDKMHLIFFVPPTFFGDELVLEESKSSVRFKFLASNLKFPYTLLDQMMIETVQSKIIIHDFFEKKNNYKLNQTVEEKNDSVYGMALSVTNKLNEEINLSNNVLDGILAYDGNMNIFPLQYIINNDCGESIEDEEKTMMFPVVQAGETVDILLGGDLGFEPKGYLFLKNKKIYLVDAEY